MNENHTVVVLSDIDKHYLTELLETEYDQWLARWNEEIRKNSHLLAQEFAKSHQFILKSILDSIESGLLVGGK